jgi:hypothetical protein
MKIDLMDSRIKSAIVTTLMRTKLAGLLMMTAVGVAPMTRADITLGAPGVPAGSKVATAVPFKVNMTLANGYKFVFSGIEAKGNTAGAPGASGTNGNGGQFHVSATVTTDVKTKEGNIEFRDVQDFNSAPLKQIIHSPSVVYRATTTPVSIGLEWKGEGNAHKPDGIFNILGEYQKAPPVPTGSLTFPVGDWMLVPPGTPANPNGTVKIVRE